jgi:serralysin
MTITLDGSLSEWTAGDRLETSATAVTGYQLFGRVEGDTFNLALHSDAVAIGPNTTFWLNTDGNPTTGLQIFGSYLGAELKVDFDAGGVPHLYNAMTGNFVSDVQYALSQDGLTLELALPRSILGGASMTSLGILADINDNVYLPGAYANGSYALLDPAASQFDGNLNDWTQAQRLDFGSNVQAGYELYGKFANNAFVFGVKSAIDIGIGTTFWFNTDQNHGTGYEIFGSALGAEYNVNIGNDGVARLYAGAAGETFVGNIDFKIAQDHRSIEFELPKTLIGNAVTKVEMLADINDTAFLPAFYTNPSFSVTDPASLPPPVTAADGLRIAIVYSETSANNYFSTMAYSQLIMTAQSQAMAAGIPFDLISESDLNTGNLANLAHYDAIVFPFFRNADSAHYQEIASVLHTLVYDHAIPLIAGGEFMTNDQNGNLLPGNPYDRMIDLLGVTRVGGDSSVTDAVIAGGTSITSAYSNGETIHTYTNAGTNYFDAVTPNTVVATQLVNGTSHNGVLATVTGGHNVVFSSEALLADSNLLGKAIDYATSPSAGVEVSLHMTREVSITSSRTDMDQAKELSDTNGANGGIYAGMASMLQNLKLQYDFVGSYYFDIGLGSLYENTGPNWAKVAPLAQQLLAMGNEVGSHSFTHPENTNFLLPNQLTQDQLDSIRAQYFTLYGSQGLVNGDFTPFALSVDTDNQAEQADKDLVAQMRTMTLADINAALTVVLASINSPGSLDKLHQAILDATFQFQFATAKTTLESQFGITLDGAAIPGMPDTLDTAHTLLRYYNYISGGGSLVGAGYPGAIGYLTPTDTKVYIAPNVPFDFTLVGFQHHTWQEAEAIWLQDFQDLSKNSDQPIIVWPWHDYSFMNFGPDGAPYNQEMFTAFIAAAHAAGTEFVTGDDLAQRIAAFDKSSLSYTVSGDTISVTAGTTAGNLGTFALDFDSMGAKHIQSVTGWYAYDDNSVFLDADGGSFQVQLGTTTDDVTHITSIGQRAKLISLSGNGTNLDFNIVGEGKVVVDLKNMPGYTLAVTGATYTQNGEILTLDLGAIGSHQVSIQQNAPVNTAPTDITVTGQVGLLEETGLLTKVATLAVVDNDTDAAFRNNVITVSDSRFMYDPTDGGLYLKAGQVVDYETLLPDHTITLTLTATDATNPALTFSKQLTVQVIDGNDGLGVLPTKVVSMERASTDTPLNLSVPADPNGDVQNFVVTSLPSASAVRLNGAALAVNQVLTLAQFQSLTYSFPDVTAQDLSLAFKVDDGHGHLDPFNVTLRVTDGVNSTLNGTASADRLDGAWGNDTINGLGGNDTLIGGIGADTIDGGTGNDSMYGGAGNDKFYVDSAGDFVFEGVGGGADIVYSTVNYTLAAGQEIETLSAKDTAGATALNLTGNEFANTLTGNAGINQLDGGAGSDKLYGLAGNDVYYVDNAGDQVFETTGAGTDTVYTTVTYALLSGQYVETLSVRDPAGTTAINLTGNELANALIGNAGNNVLNGGAGADNMSGGAGNDTYVVDNADDVVTEGANAGTDTVQASIPYTLGANLENLTLTGSASINGAGNALANVITGNSGNNILDGGTGADTMSGGVGNDTYVVDNAGDQVVEASGAGTDTVQSSISFTLGANIENLTLAGSAAINGTGNTLANVINGNSGDNTLDGGTGADTMSGGAGNDIYRVDNAADKVFEAAGQGNDTVLTTVGFALAAGQEIEALATTNLAGTTAINLTGNELGQTITGNAGNNVLNGGNGDDVLVASLGNDTLYGGLGNDSLSGGNGKDIFVFDTALNGSTNSDVITDFSVPDDTIYLENAIFTALTVTGVLAASAFKIGTVATTTAQHILYDSASGNLFYDADGSGAAGAVQFATISSGLALTNNDFAVI